MARRAKVRSAREPLPVREGIILLVAALVFRMVFWLLVSKSVFLHTPVVDASFFDIWARTLAEGRIFQAQVFFKPPFYAYLLSWLYRVGFSMTGVLVLQMMVGAVTVLLTFGVGRLVFSSRVAFTGALITALLPILPFFETQLLGETWTTPLTLGSLLLVLRVVAGKTEATGRTLFFAGMLMGLAALGRPNLMLLIVAIAGWLWWWKRSGSPAAVGLLLGGFLLAVSPATVHNLKYGDFTLISANLGPNLVAGNSDTADGISAIPVGELWDDLQLRSRQAGAVTPVQASRYLTGQSLKWIAANPGRALALVGKKAVLLVNAREGRNNINPRWFAEKEGVFLLSRWWPATWLMMPAAILGLVHFRRWRPGGGLLLWVILIQAVAILPFFMTARFRLPQLPLLALFAAGGASVLIGLWKAGDRKALIVRLGLLAALFVVVNVDWYDLGAEKWLARDWFNQGLVHSRPYGDRQPDAATAETSYRRAVELDPGQVDFNARLGSFLLGRAQPLVNAGLTGEEKGDWARADAAFDRAVPLVQEARRFHEQAATVFPRSFRSWMNLGVSDKWLGDAQAFQMRAALARNDTTTARQSALAALGLYRDSVKGFQASLQVNQELTDSRRSINELFESVMALPALDPAIVEFQRRAAEEAGNRGRR